MTASRLNILSPHALPWNYSALLGPPEEAVECTLLPQGDARPSIDARLCTERHLQILWLEQKAFLPLTSASGLAVEVVHPGIWNHGPGPDFLHAHVRIGEVDYQGAIELHLADRGWVQHGHEADERYEGVVLHVALEAPQTEKALFTKSGKSIERVYLGPFLRAPLQTHLEAIDLDLYPSPSCIGPGSCATALFENLSEGQLRTFFQSAALWRLRQKRLFLTYLSDDPAMQCAIGIAMGLGYKQNARAMARLFLHLYPRRHLKKELLLAQALGLCDFFDDHYLKLWKGSSYHAALYEEWKTSSLKPQESFALVTAQQRPAHHPVRRLAALVSFIQDASLLNFWGQFQELWRILQAHYDPSKKRSLGRMKQALIDFLPDYKQPYWNVHYTFEEKGQAPDLALIGEERREIILINAFFPLLWQEILLRGDAQEQACFIDLFSSWKTPSNAKQHYVTGRFCSNTSVLDAPFASSMMQQGAFQLHSDFCTHYEASCVGCPFIARAQEQLSVYQSSLK